MKAESIEQIRDLHGRILSATELIEDCAQSGGMSAWRRTTVVNECNAIDKCIRRLEEVMNHESQ